MLIRLEMKLDTDGNLSYQMASRFHGFLMEQISPEYAELMHQSQLHPYTQHLEKRKSSWYWIINCLSQESFQYILQDGLEMLEEITLYNLENPIKILQKVYEEYSLEKLAELFYKGQCSRYLQIHFISPTAFKQNGRYLFFPDIRCIYQSLMNKYDAVVGDEGMKDEETLAYLCDNTQMVWYDLKSVSYHLEGVKIPSYIGKITLKIKGAQTMVNFAHALFQFGEYSGVGIKTSLGMGAIKLEKREKDDR